jgi:uncharacterized protein YjbI with pentapeptide repeats
MANEEHVAGLRKGVVDWNKWRDENQDVAPDFSGANLSAADLSAANLAGATFESVPPDPEDSESESISAASLSGAKLHNADLSDARLSDVIGLQAGQLAGANLSNAKLPSDIAEFNALKHVEENSKHARSIFLAMVGACVYVWLTIATTTDAALLTNSRGTPLPIINAAVPIAWFYWAVPAILLVLYFYLHLYLQSMWDGLGKLPAIFPDGRRLDETAYPWLLTSMVTVYVFQLKRGRPPLSRLKIALSVIAAWLLVPITLLGCWLRYLPKHDMAGSLYLVSASALATWAGVFFYLRMQTTLFGKNRSGPVNQRLLQAVAPFLVLLVTGVLTNHAIRGLDRFNLLGFATYAELTEKDVSIKPDNWTGLPPEGKGKEDRYMEAEVARLKGANLRYADLRLAEVRAVFLVKADLREANLQDAEFVRAKLNLARFRKANLRGADFFRANLQGADLYKADLQGAFLKFTNLQGADLYKADFRGADLSHAKLQGADLSHAELQGANLGSADLRDVKNQEIEQLDQACGNEETKLPERIDKSGYKMKPCPENWDKLSVRERIAFLFPLL